MRRDSSIAQEFRPARGLVRRKFKKRKGDVVGVIIHTCGSGVIRRYNRDHERKAWGSVFESASYVYQHLMDFSGHYLVFGTQCLQLCPESHVAHHVGRKGWGRYKLPQERWLTQKYDWWKHRWDDYESPLDLCSGRLWENGSVNANTIGVEVPPWPTARAPWGLETWTTLSQLILDICARHDIPLTREHIITHSDAHPIRRTTANGSPWDTWQSQFTWERLAAVAGLPMECVSASTCPDYEPPCGE